MPRLQVEKGVNQGFELLLNSGKPLIVGRDPAADFPLDDELCSRKHCALGEKKGKWLIKDLDSVNGTKLNGRMLKAGAAQKLEHGDTFEIGETIVAFLPSGHDAKDPLVGVSLGGFRIDEKLGRGAMGVVYKAHQLSLNRDVALKVLSSDVSHDERFKAMFIKEARAAAALSNNNILQVYDVGTDQDHLFIAMELATKGSVLEELRRKGELSLDRSLEILKDALNALVYAESKELVHRDIKPDNLMITADNIVKLGDLGLAATSAELDEGQAGVFGTPHYIAPEQAQGKPIDHRADIYALGASWYRMLTGSTLFSGNNARDILKRQVREAHKPLIEVKPEIPATVSSIMDKMLEKNPEDRYGSAREVLSDIDLYLANRSASVGSIGFSGSSDGGLVAVAPPKKNMWIGVAVLILVLIGVGVGVFSFLIPNNDPANTNSNPNTANSNSDPTPMSGDARADFDFTSAMEWYNNLQTRSQGVDKLKDWLEKYPEHEKVSEAQDKINEWETYLRDLEARKKQLKKAAEELRKLYDELLNTHMTINVNNLQVESAIEELTKFKKEKYDPAVDTTQVADPKAVIESFKDVDFEGDRNKLLPAANDILNEAIKGAEQFITDMQKAKAQDKPGLAQQAIDELTRFESPDKVFLSEITPRLKKYREALANAKKERDEALKTLAMVAARDKTREFSAPRSAGSVANQIREAILRFDFVKALELLEAFEKTIPESKGNPYWDDAFASLLLEISDRRSQITLERDALAWFMGDFKDNPILSTGNDFIEFSQLSRLPNAELKEFKGVSAIRIKRIDEQGNLLYQRKRPNEEDNDTEGQSVAFKSLGIVGVTAFVEFWLVDLKNFHGTKSTYRDLRSRPELRAHFIGLASLIMESNEPGASRYYDIPSRLLEDVEDALSSFPDEDSDEDHVLSKRQVKEYIAWALILKAEYQIANEKNGHDLAEATLNKIKSPPYDKTRARKTLN